MSGQAIQDPLTIKPPDKLTNRPVYVSPNKLTTFRLMHDPFKSEAEKAKWFDTSVGVVRGGNETKFLIRGSETYKDMATEIRAAGRTSTENGIPPFAYLLAWYFEMGAISMIPGDGASSPTQIFTAAAKSGVEVRAMLWSQRHARWGDVGALGGGIFFNALPGGRAIVDDKTAIIASVRVPNAIPFQQYSQRNGSHHQKVLIVNGAAGLIGYIGGVDMNRDRLDADCGGGSDPGLQDVHVGIRGPSAFDLLLLFRQRWDDYLNGVDLETDHDSVKPVGLSTLEAMARDQLSGNRSTLPHAVDAEPHRQFIQIGRTFHSGLYTRIPPSGATFDPSNSAPGETGVRKMIFHGIDTAERFIYMEDQYLFNPEITAHLQGAIAKSTFRHLIILIPGDPNVATDHEIFGQWGLRRAIVLNPLLNGPNGHKVHVFNLQKRYIHSKIYIFDDRHAIVGSANCNRRGYTHDSEADAGIFDRSSNAQAAMHFARRLRMRLWATHFNIAAQGDDPNIPVNTDDEYSEVADGIASAVHWMHPPPGARFVPYTVNNATGAAIAQQGLTLAFQAFVSERTTDPKAAALLAPVLTSIVSRAFRGVGPLWDIVLDPA